MNRKTLNILAAITAVLVVLLLVLQIGKRSGSPASGHLLLPKLAAVANNATNVDIIIPGNDQGVTIHRKDDQWVVSGRNDYPADVGKLGKLIVQLAEAQILEEKTANPEHYEKLGVGDPEHGGKGSKLIVKGPDFSFAVILGNTAQGHYRYARLADDARSYLINQNLDLPKDAGDWLAPDIVDISADKVKKVVISHADGETIVIEKTDRKQTDFNVSGIPKGRELSQATVGNTIASALDKLVLEDVRPRTSAPTTTSVVYETWEGLRISVEVAVDGEKSWVTFSADKTTDNSAADDQVAEINKRVSGWQYRLADYKKNLLTRRWKDILKPAG